MLVIQRYAYAILHHLTLTAKDAVQTYDPTIEDSYQKQLAVDVCAQTYKLPSPLQTTNTKAAGIASDSMGDIIRVRCQAMEYDAYMHIVSMQRCSLCAYVIGQAHRHERGVASELRHSD